MTPSDSAPAAPPVPGPPVREAVARPAALMSVATLSSRIAGLARESLFAALIGAREGADAFNVGFRIPNLLRDLFAEGALSGAFVPVLNRVRAERGDPAAFRLARVVLGTLLAVTGGVAFLGIAFAPALVDLLAPRVALRDLAIACTRVMFPFLPLVAAAAVLMGVLNTHRRFFLPALAPAAFNLVAIAGGTALLLAGVRGDHAVLGWAVFVLVGGLAQAGMQWRPARGVGVRGPPVVDLAFRDPDLRTIVRRMAPVALALAGTQVMLVVTTAVASSRVGWISALAYAFRIIHLPIGLVGVALGTVALAAASRRAGEGDRTGLDDVIRRGLRLNAVLGLAAAAGLLAIADPLVRLLYERREFGPAETAIVAEAVRWYALGVAFYGGTKVAVAAFHARGDTRTPMLCSLGGIAVNLGVALAGVPAIGFAALPLATAAGSAVNYGALRLLAARRHGDRAAPGLGFYGRVALAVAAVYAVARAGADLLLTRQGPLGHGGLLAVGVLSLTVAAAVVHLLALRALRIPEASFWDRRADRRRSVPAGDAPRAGGPPAGAP